MKGDGIPLTPASGPLSLRKDLFGRLLGFSITSAEAAACTQSRFEVGRYERSRVSGQGNPAQIRGGAAARRAVLFGGRSGCGGAPARRESVGRQGTDSRGRPRQGRRRQGG